MGGVFEGAVAHQPWRERAAWGAAAMVASKGARFSWKAAVEVSQ